MLHRLALADPVAAPAARLPPAPATAIAPPFLAAATVDDQQRAADCLSAAVYYEARSEPLDGQRAVAQVVLNRVRDRAFPASVCRVVYQRSAAGCQFSFACDGATSRPIEPRAWQTAQAVARAALAGNVFAPVGAATHYHTTAVLPWWAASLARIGTIGSHIFYRWGDRLGGALSFRQAYSGHELAQATGGSTSIAGRSDAATSGAFGVIVHRGIGLAMPAVSVQAASAKPVAVHPARIQAVAFGVHIHRGTSSALGAAEPAAPIAVADASS
ncbi:cell wall hydrolase [Sphingomonas bacterium]|uniref:cell wall hydrolase n=1 Tax=Sphingomonas bacterium TaxID=1895847 RepID=UPI0020C6C294|nr:cell wall hydrolase [Sphingomonas bacterium]